CYATRTTREPDRPARCGDPSPGGRSWPPSAAGPLAARGSTRPTRALARSARRRARPGAVAILAPGEGRWGLLADAAPARQIGPRDGASPRAWPAPPAAPG